MKYGFILFLAVTLISCSNIPSREPVGPVLSERQLQWHELEYYAFVHFNINTFTNQFKPE